MGVNHGALSVSGPQVQDARMIPVPPSQASRGSDSEDSRSGWLEADRTVHGGVAGLEIGDHSCTL
eukprot:11206160-Lingulodinium_polyedra.AAC.1